MGVGVTQVEPITAMRAVLKIEAAEVVASKFTDQKGREQKQFATELSVLSGAGERDGETFSEWFSFLATGETARCSGSEPMRTCSHERLLRRPQTKDSLLGRRWHGQGAGGSYLLREPLFGQTIRK